MVPLRRGAAHSIHPRMQPPWLISFFFPSAPFVPQSPVLGDSNLSNPLATKRKTRQPTHKGHSPWGSKGSPPQLTHSGYAAAITNQVMEKVCCPGGNKWALSSGISQADETSDVCLPPVCLTSWPRAPAGVRGSSCACDRGKTQRPAQSQDSPATQDISLLTPWCQRGWFSGGIMALSPGPRSWERQRPGPAGRFNITACTGPGGCSPRPPQPPCCPEHRGVGRAWTAHTLSLYIYFSLAFPIYVIYKYKFILYI